MNKYISMSCLCVCLSSDLLFSMTTANQKNSQDSNSQDIITLFLQGVDYSSAVLRAQVCADAHSRKQLEEALPLLHQVAITGVRPEVRHRACMQLARAYEVLDHSDCAFFWYCIAAKMNVIRAVQVEAMPWIIGYVFKYIKTCNFLNLEALQSTMVVTLWTLGAVHDDQQKRSILDEFMNKLHSFKRLRVPFARECLTRAINLLKEQLSLAFTQGVIDERSFQMALLKVGHLASDGKDAASQQVSLDFFQRARSINVHPRMQHEAQYYCAYMQENVFGNLQQAAVDYLCAANNRADEMWQSAGAQGFFGLLEKLPVEVRKKLLEDAAQSPVASVQEAAKNVLKKT